MHWLVVILLRADKLATCANIESVLCVQEVIEEDPLSYVLICLLDSGVVQRSFISKISVKWVELTDDGWSDRALSVKSRLAGCRSCPFWAHDMCVIVITVLNTVNERWIEGTLELFSLSRVTLQRLLSLYLLEHIIHRRCLHVMKDALLANVLAAHRCWGHVVNHGWLDWEWVLFGKSLRRWAS